MLFKNEECKVNLPHFYGYELNGSIFIITRGSTDKEDYVTDAEFREIPTKHGLYHSGFYAASLNIFNAAKESLSGFKGPIYICGHSYGGAVSTALNTIIRQEFPHLDVNTIAFAPVPAISDELNRTYGDKMVSFVNNWDLVPTLSVPNIYERIKFCFIKKIPSAKVTETIQTILNAIEKITHTFSDDVYKSLYNAIPSFVGGLYDYANGVQKHVRYPPGLVYQIHAKKQTSLASSIIDATDKLNILRVHMSSITDHLPEHYTEAINNIIP
jgi:hypothetical protein